MLKKGLILLLMFLFAVPAWASRNSIQMKGSDTMVNLGQAWAERYMERNSNEFIAVTGGGSGTGIASLINGTCDIVMSSRDVRSREKVLAEKRGVKPNEIHVGLDGLAVVVHPENPVSQLTIDQLAAIFTGKAKNWSEVGGNNERIVVLSREVNSGTHVYFKEHVLNQEGSGNVEEFAPWVLMLSSSQAIAEEVAANTATIGYYGIGYISSQQKPIAVAKDQESEYIDPTLENVLSGRYPIARPLLIYTNGTPEGLVKKFVDFMLSEEGQQIVLETDFVPIKK